MEDNNQDYENEDLQTQQDLQDDMQNIASTTTNMLAKRNKDKSAGKALRAAGKALHLTGRIVEATGGIVRKLGKGIKWVGRKTYEGGKKLWDSGKALCETGLGAILGVPVCIAAAATMGLGKLLEGLGWSLEQIGKIIEFLGRKLQDVAQAMINKANEQIREAGGSAANALGAAGNAAGAMAEKKAGASGDGDNDGPKTGGIPSLSGIIKNNKVLLIIIAIIIAIILFLVLYLLLDEKKTVDDGSFVDGDKTNVPYTVSSTIMDNMVIAADGSGGYTYGFKNESGEVVDLDQAIDSALKILKENKSDSVGYLGENNEERKALLKKMIMAEIATQYPDLTNSEDLGLGSEEKTQTTSGIDYCVDISNSNAIQTCNEEQLKQIVNKANVSQQGKDNMMSVIPDLIKFQEKYKINAVFYMAVIMAESSWGSDWDLIDPSTYNWGSVKGSNNGGYVDRNGTSWNVYTSFSDAAESWFELISGNTYFGSQKYTVYQIGPTYCNSSWSDSVSEHIQTLYSLIEITPNSINGYVGKTTDTGSDTVSEKMDASKNIKGGIKVQRKLESGTTIDLKYTSTENFNALLSANSDDVMNYYTLQKNAKTTGSSSANFSGSNNAEIIWNFLRSKGMSEVCVAAIMGNLMAESGLNTGLEEVTDRVDKGYGLAQWTFGRREQINYYANLMNKEVSDIELQLQFLWLEIDPSEDHTYANLQWGGSGYGWNGADLYQKFISITNIDEATELFCWAHERPNKTYAHVDRRKEYAKNIYETYSGKPVSSDNKLTESTSEKQPTSKSASFDNFLFIGDSRYEGIASELSGLGSNVNVCAVSSSFPHEWVDVTRNGSGTVQGRNVTLPETATNISVMLGVNNLGETSQMEQLLNNLHERYKTATIYVNSVYHLGTSYSGAANNSSIDTFNDTMRNFCNQNSWAQYIDITQGLNDASGYLKSDYCDSAGLHITSQEGKSTLVNNIKNTISGSNSASTTNSMATSSLPGYSIVVANKTRTITNIVDKYEYLGTTYTDIGHSSYNDNSKRWSSPSSGPKANNTTQEYSPTSVAYQEALKNYTLYFDFLWAILVETENTDLVNQWADLVCNNVGENSKIIVTIFSEIETTSSESSNSKTTRLISNNGSIDIADTYQLTETTIRATSILTSKLAITFADTWLMKYENTANSYDEYTSKEKEVITEKIDPKDEESNAINILKKHSVTLETLKREKYMLDKMLADNEKVSFMIDIFSYILDVANGKNNDEKSLSDILEVGSFNLATFVPVTNGNTSNSYGNGTGEGATGGQESIPSNIDINQDGYKNIFTVGNRTYKNYKQSYGYYIGDIIPAFGESMKSSGCALASIAVIASGYGIDIDPHGVVEYYNAHGITTDHAGGLSAIIGKNCEWTYSNAPQAIINQLKSGKPCMVHRSYPSGHFLTVLAISEDGTKVYVSDVGGLNGRYKTGWLDISYLNNFDRCMIIND